MLPSPQAVLWQAKEIAVRAMWQAMMEREREQRKKKEK